MTFIKSMISIAAASVIAAGLTGCGSSGSTAAGDGGGGGETPTPTSLTAVDGYVKNANAAAILVSGAPVALDFVENSHVYTLPTDTNTSNYAGLQLTYKGATADTDATYFDNDGVAGYSAEGGDVKATAAFEMYAPKGFSVVTPLSTLVYSMIDSTETNTTTLDADITAQLTAVATSLGLSTTELQSTDPLSSSNGAYALINSLVAKTVVDNSGDIAALKAIVTNLVARPAATNAAEAFASLATVDATNIIMYTSTANALIADPTIIDRVSTMNLDKVRAVASTGTFVELSNTVVASDFNVTAINIGSVNVRDLSAPGAKIKPADLNNTSIVISAKDTNGSAEANLDLIISLGNTAATVGEAVSDSRITVKVNLDLNTSVLNGTDMNGTVSNNVQIDYVKADGTSYSISDKNSTAIDLNITDLVTINEGNITVQTAAILERIDANLTVGLDLDEVASAQIVLVDNNDSLATTVVVGDTVYPAAKVTSYVESYYGAISGTGLTILDLASKTATEKKLADMRTNNTAANVKPNHTLSLAGAVDGNGTEAAPYILIANSEDTNYTMTLAGDTSADANYESNSSAAFTFTGNALLSTLADDENITTGLAASSASVAATGNIELNATELNEVNTSGAITGSISSVVTDEFLLAGDANNTLYFTLNRAPYDVNESNITADDELSIPFVTDTNLTGTTAEANATDINTSRYISILDYDGMDFNSTDGNITFADMNVSTLDRNTSDMNVSLESNKIRFQTTDGAVDLNVSFVYLEDNKFAVRYETNETNISLIPFDGNITISDYNLTDKYGSVKQITDDNITLFFDLNGTLQE